MRYVPKGISPEFFEACKKDLPENSEWQHFTENKELSECKKLLHEHLVNEQGKLCIYCERKIDKDISHIEHIKPKDTSGKYAHLVFDYKNLVASCNGDYLCKSENQAESKLKNVLSCGHRKGNHFSEDDFLNPVEEIDISKYFCYDRDTGEILAVNTNVKAQETIKILNLNNSRLNNERLNAKEAMVKIMKDTNNRYLKSMPLVEKIKILLNADPPRPFISFLKAYYSAVRKNTI